MSDESLFREVDEEVRREQVKKIWERYGTYMVAVSLVVILAVGGFKGWQHWQLNRSQVAGETYFGATADTRTPAERAKALAELAQSGPVGYALLSRFTLAGDAASAGRWEEAVKAYDALATDSSVPQALRDLATIRGAYLLVDTTGSADLAKRLAPLDKEGSIWRPSVREILALAAWREGRMADADRLVSEILADPRAPQGLRQRAQILAALVQPQLKSK